MMHNRQTALWLAVTLPALCLGIPLNRLSAHAAHGAIAAPWSRAQAGHTAEARLADSPFRLTSLPRLMLSRMGQPIVATTPATATWSQQAEITATNGASGDLFGYSVAVSGNTALVGARGTSAATGAVYVFVRSGTTWTQQAELTAGGGAASDDFGWSVSLSGNVAVIGAPGRTNLTGAAYIFVRSGTSWTQQAQLTAIDAATNDSFGQAVSISGTTVLIGAPTKNNATGAAYVFVSSKGVWGQQAKLVAGDGAANDQFGTAVSLSGNTALVGASGKNSNTGAAYVFTRSGTAWTQQAELKAGDAGRQNYFGGAVGVSGTTVVVAALGHNNGTGAAYIFVRSGTAWTQQAEVLASDGAPFDHFGQAVAISGTTVAVTANTSSTSLGAAYIFVRSGTTWSQQAELTASDGSTVDKFGFSVGLSGSTLVVGAPYRSVRTGAAYVFVRS